MHELLVIRPPSSTTCQLHDLPVARPAPAPSDHGSFASVDETALPGRKRSFAGKNGPKGNPFELLSESNDDESITVETTSARERPLKRTQPFEPNSPPRAKRTNSTKATIPGPASAVSISDEWVQVRDLLARVETALASAEQRAEKAEKRIEALEFIRNELFHRIGTTSTVNSPSPPSSPSSPPPSIAPRQIPGVGLDLSRVEDRARGLPYLLDR